MMMSFHVPGCLSGTTPPLATTSCSSATEAGQAQLPPCMRDGEHTLLFPSVHLAYSAVYCRSSTSVDLSSRMSAAIQTRVAMYQAAEASYIGDQDARDTLKASTSAAAPGSSQCPPLTAQRDVTRYVDADVPDAAVAGTLNLTAPRDEIDTVLQMFKDEKLFQLSPPNLQRHMMENLRRTIIGDTWKLYIGHGTGDFKSSVRFTNLLSTCMKQASSAALKGGLCWLVTCMVGCVLSQKNTLTQMHPPVLTVCNAVGGPADAGAAGGGQAPDPGVVPAGQFSAACAV